MFQPVGGMDRIAHALYEQVRPARCGSSSPVTAIRRRGEGVRIEHGPGGAGDSTPIIASAPCR